MGAKYLDLDGLTRYDGKIKQRLGTKLYRHELTIVGGIASSLTLITTESRPYFITNANTNRLPNIKDILACQQTGYGTGAIVGLLTLGSGTNFKMVINFVTFTSSSPYISYYTNNFTAGFADSVTSV